MLVTIIFQQREATTAVRLPLLNTTIDFTSDGSIETHHHLSEIVTDIIVIDTDIIVNIKRYL